ncbi:hypothetical protein [Eoetvoesiella caeni]|uniref:Uncharacterized protein n=1 Tax=Eoetvoesiella caeni TaxID=645616 RepID=A0A366GYC1_9BURK|nr:hypothetical protein [Eoetvoesiella caeni]MCI2811305.1 hypothetical protein [Eoetvoesiella caeni]NYT57196.1 hypothetical protein [Eoetvoesiella caeni]RBP33631.1 hypothetical protein DFR37_12622 [Eoetvoesiella caeni]
MTVICQYKTLGVYAPGVWIDCSKERHDSIVSGIYKDRKGEVSHARTVYKAKQPAATVCVGCGGNPSIGNDPCWVCGLSLSVADDGYVRGYNNGQRDAQEAHDEWKAAITSQVDNYLNLRRALQMVVNAKDHGSWPKSVLDAIDNARSVLAVTSDLQPVHVKSDTKDTKE